MTQSHDLDHQHDDKPNHHDQNDAQISYQPTIKIKNSNTHLGITIRWVEQQSPELILNDESAVAG
jgi:hypothetical protein